METTENRQSHPTDAAQAQFSDYSGVSDADLAEIRANLNQRPATNAVMAVLGRVKAEMDRRR